MTDEETFEKLYDLTLGAMAEAFREMLARPGDAGLSFPERLGLLVDREVFLDLVRGGYLRHHHNVLITGATGVGKTYLACALADRACRDGFTATYYRLVHHSIRLDLKGGSLRKTKPEN